MLQEHLHIPTQAKVQRECEFQKSYTSNEKFFRFQVNFKVILKVFVMFHSRTPFDTECLHNVYATYKRNESNIVPYAVIDNTETQFAVTFLILNLFVISTFRLKKFFVISKFVITVFRHDEIDS